MVGLGMLDTLKKKEKKDTKAIWSKELKKRRFWLKQSQSKWLAFIVTRCEECERKKRRKR